MIDSHFHPVIGAEGATDLEHASPALRHGTLNQPEGYDEWAVARLVGPRFPTSTDELRVSEHCEITGILRVPATGSSEVRGISTFPIRPGQGMSTFPQLWIPQKDVFVHGAQRLTT